MCRHGARDGDGGRGVVGTHQQRGTTSSEEPTAADPTVADTDYDVQAVCLFLDIGFLQVNVQYLDWQAATVAGTTPPVPTEQVAAAIEQAVTESEVVVADVDQGETRDAGTAVLEQAGALAAAMRAGGWTDPTAFGVAFDELDAACPDRVTRLPLVAVVGHTDAPTRARRDDAGRPGHPHRVH